MTAREGRWAVALGAGPVLIVGLLTSGVANRLDFVTWAAVSAAAYVTTLVVADRRGWTKAIVVAVAAWVLAIAFAAHGLLVRVHHEAFDAGMRAFVPGLYHPLLTRPAMGYGVAVACGLVGLLVVLLATPLGRRRSITTGSRAK